MLKITSYYILIFTSLISSSLLFSGQSMETAHLITSTSPIRYPKTLISPNKVFKLGFYSPENNPKNRYMAIFYAFSEKTAVWIANRDNPLKDDDDSSALIAISKEGNLVLLNGEKNEVVWSTNITTANTNNRTNATAHILDNGNMVLRESSTGKVLWESFSHPSHILMSSMALVDDTRTGKKVTLSSWKNESDPGIGTFKAGIQAMSIPQFMVWHDDGRPHYRSGPWNGQMFIGSRHMYKTYHTRAISITKVSPGVFHFVENLTDHMMLVLGPTGTKYQVSWNDRNNSWLSFAFSPENECDVYGKCGAFGVCDIRNSPKICSCLKGFEPARAQEWEMGNWTSGCVRKTPLQCEHNDGFLRLRNMKVPDYAERFESSSEDECRVLCSKNCSCVAYAHDSYDIGCMFWKEGGDGVGLIDAQKFPYFGVDFHIRLAASELDDGKGRRTLAIVVMVVGIALFVAVSSFFAWFWMRKKKVREAEERSRTKANESSDSTAIFLQDESKRSINVKDLPLFSFSSLAIATNNFSGENFIGRGGFGHVYKGKLQNGKEIAVKRLSEASRQGTEEFLNEVSVISKLQHRNLVRLMGCCVDKEEKMLIYEYMTNKSLDVFLFDHSHPSRKVLDWEKRLNIIKGISRGLVYLHRDSRLRIIHRDLKASNVLLDEELRPKISDFGMARIFSANQNQANTMRVVGTYGYMAPEYATAGEFSEKSDVYSFGVLMLEIISGRKNSHYCAQNSSILGSAWKFLTEGNGVGFPDEDVLNENSADEIVRCVHIALLCVQEYAEERPTVQTVLSMLNGEIVDLPMVEKPMFADKWNSTTQSTAYIDENSVNELTITELRGR